VLVIRPNPMRLTIGVAGPYPAGAPYAYEVRAFYSEGGSTFEDPVTGSLNASLAQWLIGSGRFAAPYLASQGAALGRAGVVRITTDHSGAVWVGGDVATCISGTVEL
jgi:predicted PhzF superfamily epimerase YddE/YHI9